MKAENIRINGMKSPVGISRNHIRITWNNHGKGIQSAYQVMAEDARNGRKLYSSKRISGPDLSYVLPKPTPWQTPVRVTVTLWDEAGNATSSTACFETAIAPKDLTADWISPEENDPADEEGHKPAGYLRRKFTLHTEDLTEYTTGRLYATAHGVYVIYINGQPVSDSVLAPGTAEYTKRQPYQTYDVTGLLKEGENEITAALGEGWYRSESGIHGDRYLFGRDLSLLAQLDLLQGEGNEISRKTIITTDASWEAGTGPILMNDMRLGETCDARILPFQDLHAARVENLPKNTLLPSDTVPIREQEHFTVSFAASENAAGDTPTQQTETTAGANQPCVLHTPDGSTVLDFGQNLAGYIAFHIPEASAGQRIHLQCGETLDENGNFTMSNILEGIDAEADRQMQSITYTCRDGVNDYKTSFTIMGFRYAKLDTDLSSEELQGSTFTAIAVYSDMEVTSGFSSSDSRLNQLFQNSLWSMKGNFCDIPTDCPTRERSGWTGDAGLFCETGLRMMNTAPVFRKWLAECRACQYPDGKLANIAPQCGRPTGFTQFLAASVGWGDASILVPLALYQWTGDLQDLADNYEMMTKWYGFLEGRAAQMPPEWKDAEDVLEKYVIDTGIDYGEWCEPGSDARRDMASPNRAVSTGYFAYSGRLMARIADLLGHHEDAEHYRSVSALAREAFISRFTEQGVVNSTHQADYIRAIRFDLIPEDKKQINADKLNENVIANDYHLNTGFLSTPYLCSILADYGHSDTAYRLLLQDTAPSWLYAVKKGATTIWETWNGIDEAGCPHASLNHYSYGAISGWLLSGVCGIRIADGKINIQPVLPTDQALTAAEGYIDSPLGRVCAGWKLADGKCRIYGSIPDGQSAMLTLPNGSTRGLGPGEFSVEV